MICYYDENYNRGRTWFRVKYVAEITWPLVFAVTHYSWIADSTTWAAVPQCHHSVVVRYTYMLQTLFIFHSHLAQLGLIAQFLYTAVITPDTYNHLLQLYTISRPSNHEQVTPGVDNANV